MTSYVWFALPERWMARLSALMVRQSRQGRPAVPSGDGRDRGQDPHPTTMQIIERVSAQYQEKLGFGALYFAGEFRRMC